MPNTLWHALVLQSLHESAWCAVSGLLPARLPERNVPVVNGEVSAEVVRPPGAQPHPPADCPVPCEVLQGLEGVLSDRVLEAARPTAHDVAEPDQRRTRRQLRCPAVWARILCFRGPDGPVGDEV